MAEKCVRCGHLEEILVLERRKCSKLIEWRDMLKGRTIRQADQLGQFRRVVTALMEDRFETRSEVFEALLPRHPEVLDAEWKQPALRPSWAINGHIAMFETEQEAQEVAEAYFGGDPVRMFGTWATAIGERAPDGDAQYYSQLFVLANPDYRPAGAPNGVTGDD